MIQNSINAPVALMIKSLETIEFRDRTAYASFLAQSFHYVSHSTRLLAFAAGLMPRTEERYFRRFIKHIGEEVSHEILAQKDIEDLGLDIKDFPELPETKMLWESQYTKIQHLDPMSFMGYILVLEQIGCEFMPRALEHVKAAYDGKAQRFVRLHAEEDPDHVTKAIEFSETLSKERQFWVLENALQTAKAYSSMIKASNEVAVQRETEAPLSL